MFFATSSMGQGPPHRKRIVGIMGKIVFRGRWSWKHSCQTQASLPLSRITLEQNNSTSQMRAKKPPVYPRARITLEQNSSTCQISPGRNTITRSIPSLRIKFRRQPYFSCAADRQPRSPRHRTRREGSNT